jgi:hypothetical protein
VEGIGDRLHFRSGLSYDHNYAASPGLRFQRRAPWRGTNRTTILRMNELLNDLITKKVGVNDGCFMAKALAAK